MTTQAANRSATTPWAWALAALTLSPACASFSTHLTPRPTEPGKIEVDANVDVLSSPHEDGSSLILPNVEMGIRYGLSDTADVGAKLNFFGGQLNSRIAVLLSDRLDIAVVPSAGLTWIDSSIEDRTGFVTFGLPILGGLRLGEEVTLVLGTHFDVHLATLKAGGAEAAEVKPRAGDLILYPGGVIGAELRFSEVFCLFPELNFLFPYLTEHDKFARPIWQGGIGFQFKFRP